MSLKKFHDIHKGQTCYIFGDGPSIKWFDLTKFDDHIGISCGAQVLHNDFSKLDVRYYSIVEPFLFCPNWMKRHQYLRDLKIITNEYRNLIKIHNNITFFLNLSNFPFIWGSNIHYIHRYLQKGCNKFSKFGNLDPFVGSFQATLSLAYYMGFSKVYLVGFDAWTIQPSRTLRWYELGNGELYNSNNFAIPFLNILKEHMEICTISHEGTSCNVNNINYESYTGQKPLFRENYELLSPYYLKMLGTFPDYKIF